MRQTRYPASHGKEEPRPGRVSRVVYACSGPLGEGGVINDEKTPSASITRCARTSARAPSHRPCTSAAYYRHATVLCRARRGAAAGEVSG
jgi:hypothetical protein